jgi:hypothetical protein
LGQSEIVLIVNSTLNEVTKSITVSDVGRSRSLWADSISFDPANNNMYVENSAIANSNNLFVNVSMISSTTNSVLHLVNNAQGANVNAISPYPLQMVYDSSNHDLYIPLQSNSGSSPVYLTIISSLTNAVVTTLHLSQYNELGNSVYNPKNSYVYVISNNVLVISS